MHIGSQLATFEPYGAALLACSACSPRLRADGADASSTSTWRRASP
jgi:hypothetical protein